MHAALLAVSASMAVFAIGAFSACGGEQGKPAAGGAGGTPGDGSAGDSALGLDASGCWQGNAICDGSCVDLGKDPKHCGGCTTICAAGQVCSVGKCAASCAAPTTACGSSCADLQKDPEHCGACNSPCAPNEACSAGKCVATCPAGQANCGGGCIDVASTAKHCGTCGNDCLIGSCIAGKCQCGDATKDGDESDIDCGGSCLPCAEGKACNAASDCKNGLDCVGKTCWRAPPLDADLVAYYRLEGNGTDASPNGNNASASNANPVAGKVGQAMQIGAKGCLAAPDSNSLDLTGLGRISFIAWIQVSGDCAPADRGIILNKEETYEFGIQCGGSNTFQEAIQLSDGLWAWNGSGTIAASGWQHVALSWDGTTVRHYVNGAEVYTRALSGQFAARTTGLGIGCRSVSSDGTLALAGSHFVGAIDEVAIYKRALGAAEISAYYAATQ